MPQALWCCRAGAEWLCRVLLHCVGDPSHSENSAVLTKLRKEQWKGALLGRVLSSKSICGLCLQKEAGDAYIHYYPELGTASEWTQDGFE